MKGAFGTLGDAVDLFGRWVVADASKVPFRTFNLAPVVVGGVAPLLMLFGLVGPAGCLVVVACEARSGHG